MKIIIAPDSFKESLTAAQAANAIARGLQKHLPDAECVCVPMADGGEGTSDALVNALGGEWVYVDVDDPLGRTIRARYGVLANGTAVMEMAQAAGIHLLAPAERNPRLASTFGVGQMMKHALQNGVRHIILGIGGSATNDGGAGMAMALGYRLESADGKTLPRGGAALANLARVDNSQVLPELAECTIEVACDVNNPLCGANGASAIFGPQKGADAQMVAELDAALNHYADVLTQAGFTDAREQAGSGAAGGLGFALRMLCHAELKSGVQIVMNANGLANHIQNADLVITGEGKMDGQTACGKVPAGVLQTAQQHKVPVFALCGALGDEAEKLNQAGFAAVLPILPNNAALPDLLADAEQNLQRTAEQIGSILALKLNKKA
ncbi:MAG: glycerate kinase [Neisseria sp.]|nr:glycerate kinase [Neisseria sp.]